jgi:hypothetical protein
VHRRQAETRGCVLSLRLEEKIFWGNAGHFAVKLPGLGTGGYDKNPFPGDQGLDPVYRLPDHGLGRKDGKDLLGPHLPAPGPETGPAAAGHDDRKYVGFLHMSLFQSEIQTDMADRSSC